MELADCNSYSYLMNKRGMSMLKQGQEDSDSETVALWQLLSNCYPKAKPINGLFDALLLNLNISQYFLKTGNLYFIEDCIAKKLN